MRAEHNHAQEEANVRGHYDGPSKSPLSIPSWWHASGGKVEMVPKERQNMLTWTGDLVLNNGVKARIKIDRVERRQRFTLQWSVQHAGGLDMPRTSGLIELSANELDQALSLNDTMADFRDLAWLFAQYGATVAGRGKFIRWGRYLNIPGPGTAVDGDANLSIFVSDEIRAATTSLLQQVQAKT